MASWSFFEGKTVDAAIISAGKELGIPVEELKYEIVFSGSSGIFGLVGAKNAKIRVMMPETCSRSTASNQSEADRERQEILSLVDETFADTNNHPDPEVEVEAPKPTSPKSGGDEPEKQYTEADFDPESLRILWLRRKLMSRLRISRSCLILKETTPPY